VNPSHILRLLGGAPLLLALAACSSSPSTPADPVSLLGTPLESQAIPEARRRWLQLELDAAMAAWEAQPDEMHVVWVGRRLAYLGQYRAAIAWYEGALATFPQE
jgi:hypothetical protein